MSVKSRIIGIIERQLSPIFHEIANFIEEHIGINLFKYLPLLLFWYWLIIISIEEFIKANLSVSFVIVIIVTVFVIGRDLRKRYLRKRARDNEVLVKDQPKDGSVHN